MSHGFPAPFVGRPRPPVGSPVSATLVVTAAGAVYGVAIIHARRRFRPMFAPRRSFLAASAGVLAGGSIKAAAWPGAFAGVRSPEVLNVAVVGCGGQGRHNLREVSRFGGTDGLPAVRVAAVCDADADRLTDAVALADESNAAAGVTGGVRAFADYQDLLAGTPDLDAVVVATPDHRHAAPAVAAADAGLAVYCEKPLANSVEDCDAIRDAARRNRTVFQVGTHERSNPRVRRACELVRGGVLGEVRRVVLQMPVDQGHHRAVISTPAGAPRVAPPASLDYAAWLGPGNAGPEEWPDMRAVRPDLPDWMVGAGPHFWWRFKNAFGAGELTDRGAHILDVAQLALGRDDGADWEPTDIKATGTVPDGFYDAVMDYSFELTFPSGPPVVGTTSGERGVRFEGENGELFVAIHGGGTTADPPELLDALVGVDLGRVPGHHANFLAAVLGRAEPVAPLEAGYRTAVLCHRVNAALRGDR